MGCMSESTPSFFKFLADDSIDYLPICPAFVDKYLKGPKFPKNPIIIKTENEETIWTVEIEEMGRRSGKQQQQHCFVKGWLQFVKDNLLQTGDFLVFWLISPSVFLVAMYGPSCCEKLPNPGCRRDTHEQKKPKVEDASDEDSPNTSDSAEELPWFSSVVKKSYKYFMPFRRGFVTKNWMRGKKRVVLRNEKGREWEVGIGPRQRYRPYTMTRGWFRFRKENKVEVGDTCVFRLLSTQHDEAADPLIPILGVHVIRKAKRKRGRPTSH